MCVCQWYLPLYTASSITGQLATSIARAAEAHRLTCMEQQTDMQLAIVQSAAVRVSCSTVDRSPHTQTHMHRRLKRGGSAVWVWIREVGSSHHCP